MAKLELYGSSGCPYTQEMREWLEWHEKEFVEYDVDSDPSALERMIEATRGQRTVPVLIEDGKVTHIGWQGRGCIVGRNTSPGGENS
jgi:glutaredoxin